MDRIHVERQMKRTKAWRYFQTPVPLDHKGIVGDAFVLCSWISNMLLPPLAPTKEREAALRQVYGVAVPVGAGPAP